MPTVLNIQFRGNTKHAAIDGHAERVNVEDIEGVVVTGCNVEFEDGKWKVGRPKAEGCPT